VLLPEVLDRRGVGAGVLGQGVDRGAQVGEDLLPAAALAFGLLGVACSAVKMPLVQAMSRNGAGALGASTCSASRFRPSIVCV
jgi:hypothetical protein